MEKDTIYVALDDSKRKPVVAMLRPAATEPEEREIPKDPPHIQRLFRRLQGEGPVQACYEARVSGYDLSRQITACGVTCQVIAPALTPRRPGQRKTDRRDLASRLASRVQLTTDGHKVYLEAVEGAFGNAIDYAMLIKMYEGDSGKHATAERRYSPATCTGIQTQRITGDPDPDYISTSFEERQNLTMRMSMRRFTRLTNGFSRKVDNLKAAVALHFMHYNFARIHQTLRVTPAMEAGVSDHVWSIEEIVRLLETGGQSN